MGYVLYPRVSHYVTAVPVAVLVIVYSVLTPTNLLLGALAAALLMGVAVLLDRVPISFRSPLEYRATLLILPIVIVLGVYTILTPTNVLLWVAAGGVLLGIGLVVDVVSSDDESN